MKLSQMFLERFRDLETNSRGKIYSHKLNQELQSAKSFAARVDQDGADLVYLFPDRSRLRVDNPAQVTDKASFHILSNVG
jgi:hypothetical protein